MNTWSHPSQHICPPEISSLTTFAFSSKSTKRKGEVFTFSNIYLCIQYQVQKCKYPESIIKSIRSYRESNTNCNKVNKLVLFSYHTCKSAPQSHTTKVPPVCFGFIHSFNYFKLYKTDYHKYSQLFLFLRCVCWKNTKTSVYTSIYCY